MTGDAASIDGLTQQIGAFYRLGKPIGRFLSGRSQRRSFLIDPTGRLFVKFKPPLDANETIDRFLGLSAHFKPPNSKQRIEDMPGNNTQRICQPPSVSAAAFSAIAGEVPRVSDSGQKRAARQDARRLSHASQPRRDGCRNHWYRKPQYERGAPSSKPSTVWRR